MRLQFFKNLHYPNKYLPAILAIGISIAVANYSLWSDQKLGELLFTHIITSLIIGYGLLFVAHNVSLASKSKSIKYLLLAGLFSLIGVVASEVEFINRVFFFKRGSFELLGGREYYLFNAIISTILGFGFYFRFNPLDKETAAKTPAQKSVERIPVRKGSDTLLKTLEEISYFQAADNFSILVDQHGSEFICDSSLKNLQLQLPDSFVRVHRSYLVHVPHIRKITPYDKSRFVLTMQTASSAELRSGASYKSEVRKLMMLPR